MRQLKRRESGPLQQRTRLRRDHADLLALFNGGPHHGGPSPVATPRLGKIARPKLLERPGETIGAEDPEQWRPTTLHRLEGITALVQTLQPDIRQLSREHSLVHRLQHPMPPPRTLQALTTQRDTHS